MAQRDNLAILLPDLVTESNGAVMSGTTAESGYPLDNLLLPGVMQRYRPTTNAGTFYSVTATWPSDKRINFIATAGHEYELLGYDLDDCTWRAALAGGADGNFSAGAHYSTAASYAPLVMRDTDTGADWEAVEDWNQGITTEAATASLSDDRLCRFVCFRSWDVTPGSTTTKWAKGYWLSRTVTIAQIRATPSGSAVRGFAKLYAGYAWQPEVNVARDVELSRVRIGGESVRRMTIKVNKVHDAALFWKLRQGCSRPIGLPLKTFVALTPRQWRSAYSTAFPCEMEIVSAGIGIGSAFRDQASYANDLVIRCTECHSWRPSSA